MNFFKDWLKQPFSPDMTAGGWFAFFGLLIVISVLWSFTLRHIREAVT